MFERKLDAEQRQKIVEGTWYPKAMLIAGVNYRRGKHNWLSPGIAIIAGVFVGIILVFVLSPDNTTIQSGKGVYKGIQKTYEVPDESVVEELPAYEDDCNYDYTSPTTHTSLDSTLIDYNIAIGCYGYEETLYDECDNIIAEKVVKLQPGEYKTVTVREGFDIEVYCYPTEQENEVYTQDRSNWVIRGITINPEIAGYFTINGQNVSNQSPIERIEEILGIKFDHPYRSGPVYINNQIAIFVNYGEVGMSYFSCMIGDVEKGRRDPYGVVHPERSVITPTYRDTLSTDVPDVGIYDVAKNPLIIAGYPLGNWTTQEMVSAAFGDNDTGVYTVGDMELLFVFEDRYLTTVAVQNKDM